MSALFSKVLTQKLRDMGSRQWSPRAGFNPVSCPRKMSYTCPSFLLKLAYWVERNKRVMLQEQQARESDSADQ